MKKYGLNELRQMFLDFFESKGHLVKSSYSLVPHNDNSLLLINAGMAPLKPYFTGQEVPPRTRMATCQKCIRTGDIENIGKTARHGTFFEMLGNFSFGDYFKHEAIHWSWEFLTEVVGLEADRLYPSVYLEDDEAFDIWNKEMGIPKDRIFKFGKEDNFWEHGAGPCGPCSEIYYDRGEKYGCGKPDCTVGCECDRYIEIWNNVFTQFENDGKGNYTTLKQKNIDTGMGLERLATVVQDVDSIFDVDTIKALRDKVCEISGKEYKKEYKWDVSIRIITDHIRSATFMISDGIMPSNEGRGYVLRRLIRRAARHGRLLGIDGMFLSDLSETVIESSKDGYPELEEKKNMIFKVLTEEENKFNKTIDTGLNILAEMEAKISEEGNKTLSGDDAFKLYDTYGFPLDLTKEILEEKGFSVDEEGFKKAMEVQREKARNARKTTNYMGADETVYESLDKNLTSKFVGYDKLENESEITALTTEKEVVQALAEGDNGTILVNETPFYATMGGQTGDKGIIETANGKFKVVDTIKLHGSMIGHVGYVVEGMVQVGDKVALKVYSANREAIAKNHSATHLLQKALKLVLGEHVEQAGSYVDAERLRFDFTHFQAMTKEEIAKVESIVNEQIANGLDVVTKEMTLEEAKKTGAMALFGEKYGDTVRVVSMGDFSVELCGGTHVSNTKEISYLKVISEAGISAGVRRIEALTGNGLIKHFEEMEKLLNEAAKAAKSDAHNLTKKIHSLNDEIKSLSSENEKLKAKLANESVGDALDNVVEVKGVKLLATKVADVDMNGLRNLGDQLKEKMGGGVVVIVSTTNDKANVIVMADNDAISKGAHAGNMIKEIAKCVGGGGGGRPNMAQAGGKNPAGADMAIEKAKEILESQL
ncbi:MULTISPECIES: alanine--tRNA ligase [unclassified Eubacterium (in: firmicutes)]|uniref:alanine--tRNA ligase n=1 Tax=unclassified Eubacterium (in: firmicutes) TaxID=2624479 RepID=UPI000E4EFFE7|nr:MULTISPECIES: alanine--tRNA ligase [unclassified Eubacterium (in: firmicutes)]RGF51036.1 alanine--tRNA ligase [Eubacterium sp. AF36-5BH]RHP21767.1 alanine--tRNA ligase [Eubacterium sp. AF34-35BH]